MGSILRILTVACCAAFVLLAAGCKSNTAVTRGMKAMTTKYNIYFNGNEAYKEGVIAMEESHQDKYSQRLALHPVYQLVGQEEPSSNAEFDRAIEKCKIAVQRRSITNKPRRRTRNTPAQKLFMQRGEYNPFMHNVWLLNGKALFYKGDFTAAASIFNYVAHHFNWKKYAVIESHIWAARVYAVQGFSFDAETELGLVIPAKQYTSQSDLSRLPLYKDLPRDLRQAFSLAQAEILLSRPETATQAVEYLRAGRGAFMSATQRLRADYLMAQLLEERGDHAQAYKLYGKLGHSGRDYQLQFNAKMARIGVMAQDNGKLKQVESRLNRMRYQSRNEEYLDQIYHALGNVALLQKDTVKAIRQLEQAIEKSSRKDLDMAAAALRLGEVSFAQEDYVRAQKAYSTAMGIIDKNYKGYDAIAKLSAVLDELQTHAETVQLQDSLLQLSELPKEELDEVIDRIIKDLIKAEKEAEEEERLAEYRENQEGQVDPLAPSQPQQPTVGKKDNSWYFYNPTLLADGKREFQRLWGNRKNEDNWRRKNKTETLAFDEPETTEEDENSSPQQILEQRMSAERDSLTGGNLETESLAENPDNSRNDSLASDPHEPAYYLAQIPFSEEQKQEAHQQIEEGLYNMGQILNVKLENFPLSIKTFVDVEQRYPESEHRLHMYYAIYLMYMRMSEMAAREGNTVAQNSHKANAETWRKKLIATFPESDYGVALTDPNYVQTLREMTSKQDSLYRQTYSAYLANHTDTVHANYEFVQQHWPLCTLMPKFLFLETLSYVQDGDLEGFKQGLEKLTTDYPESDVSPLASLMLKGAKEGRQLQLGSTMQSMVWSTSLRGVNAEGEVVDSTKVFSDAEDVPHLLLLAFKTDSLEMGRNNLLFEIAKFNFENYLVKDFDLEFIDTGNGLTVLVISGFADLYELEEYHDRLESTSSIQLPTTLTQIDISDENFRLLLQGRTFEEYFEWLEGLDGVEEEETPE